MKRKKPKPRVVTVHVVMPPSPPPKEWVFSFHHHGELADVNVVTGALSPTEAGQYLKDTVDEMRAIMGKAKKYPRVAEPYWLTDAINKGLAKRKRELE